MKNLAYGCTNQFCSLEVLLTPHPGFGSPPNPLLLPEKFSFESTYKYVSFTLCHVPIRSSSLPLSHFYFSFESVVKFSWFPQCRVKILNMCFIYYAYYL